VGSDRATLDDCFEKKRMMTAYFHLMLAKIVQLYYTGRRRYGDACGKLRVYPYVKWCLPPLNKRNADVNP
jgi:hypothetical protein